MFLAASFAVVWIVAAINPLDRGAWLLENLLVIGFIPVVLVIGRYFKVSDASYTLITLFLIMHIIGSHWTYAEVPFGFTLGEWLGTERNMYDRLLHFSFGFLMAYPIREIFLRVTGARGFWSYYIPLDIVLSFSAIYEVLEWGALAISDSSTGTLFLAHQGDIFDPAKDIANAGVGALTAMLIVLGLNWALNREEFRGEMKESLKIKGERRAGRVPIKELVR
jgi:putative membrane protein